LLRTAVILTVATVSLRRKENNMEDKKLLEQMIAERYISVQKHPTLDLYIHNYTQKAQFDRVWNEATLQCRGLIMDKDDNIVARPFPKFFNYAEAVDKGEQIPAEDFIVTEKMDGSLGILYSDGVRPCIATRGSFISDQAIKGTSMLPFIGHVYWDQDYTYLFEIIYPTNRIVVDYGDREELVLLAAIETRTGEELSYAELQRIGKRNSIKVVEKYDGIRDFDKIEERPNSEGYVITFTNGQRYKIKHQEYVRLHRLVTGVNSKTVWELLKNGDPIDELLDRVPDEFYNWVRQTREKLQADYTQIEKAADFELEHVEHMKTRKEQALWLKDHGNYAPIVFAMLSNKPYKDIIWKQVRPKIEHPFKDDIDA
jgi:T4 RnlA family RNA ligase